MSRIVREAVSDAITNHLSDPRIEGFVSVTRVEMSADLRNAEVFISVFGKDEKSQKKTFIAIDHAKSRIQSLLAARIKSRFCPILHFHVDEKLKKTLEVMNIIHKAASEFKEQEQEPEDQEV